MLIVRSRRVILPDREQPATVHIDSGTITRVSDYDDVPAGAELVDAGRDIVGPGLVDTHVHVNEPGRTDWEGFDTATRAAAAGGITTVVDMPLNAVPPTTTVVGLDAKRASAGPQAHVDVAFWGGVVPGNPADLEPLIAAGVRGFKCFLAPSGVDEFPMSGEGELRAALSILARHDLPLLVHAEAPEYLSTPVRSDYAAFLASRPPMAEAAAIRMVAGLAGEHGARVHVVHVASLEAADEVRQAKASGVRVTAETCPHYLTFASADIPSGATEFKCAPPIRGARHREALWRALRSGTLDLVATDHSPAPAEMKCRGNFARAWGGIASLELSLAAVWTAAGDGPTPADLFRWMSAAPARLAGLAPRKGSLAAGADADLVVWDPHATWTVDPRALQQRHKLTPYAGRRLRGRVKATFLRGVRVWREGALASPRTGRLL